MNKQTYTQFRELLTQYGKVDILWYDGGEDNWLGFGGLKWDGAAGKTVQARITLHPSAFEFFDRTSGKMSVTAGDYEVWYGGSSDAKDLKMTTITVR